MKYLYWLCFYLSFVALLTIVSLDGFFDHRRKILELFIDDLHQDISFHISKISSYAHQLSSDQILINSVDNGLANTYSSDLKNLIDPDTITDIGIYDKSCGVFFEVSIEHPRSICSVQSIDQVQWISNYNEKGEKTEKILAITKKLGENNLISVGYKPDFYHTKLVDHLQVDEVAIAEAYQFDLNKSYLSYLYSFEPVIIDNHPISKYYHRYTAPYSSNSLSSAPYLVILMCCVLLLFYYYHRKLSQYRAKFITNHQLIKKELININPGLSVFTLGQLIDSYKKKLKKIKIVNCDHRKKIDYLSTSLESLNKQMSQLALYKALIWEVERNAQLLHQESFNQDLIIDNIDHHIKTIHKIYTFNDSNILARWRKDIDSMGYRKFLRTYLEVPSKENSTKSVFAHDLDILSAGSENIRNISMAISNGCKEIYDQSRNYKMLIKHWSTMFSQDNSKIDTNSLIYHTLWQIRTNYNYKINLQVTDAQELKNHLPKSFAQMIRCVLYESISYIIKGDKETSLYFQFLKQPVNRILITARYSDYLTNQSLSSSASNSKDNNFNVDDKKHHHSYESLRKLQQRISLIGRDYATKFEKHRTSYNADGVCYSLSWDNLCLSDKQVIEHLNSTELHEGILSNSSCDKASIRLS